MRPAHYHLSQHQAPAMPISNIPSPLTQLADPSLLRTDALIGGLWIGGASRFAVTDPASVLDISGLWLFHTGDNLAFARPNLDDTRWDQRRAPTGSAVWNFRWSGYAWYRLHINVDADVAEWQTR